MTRRSLFKSVFNCIAAMFGLKSVCSKVQDLPDISQTLSSSSCTSLYYIGSNGRIIYIKYWPLYSGAYSFWDDPSEDIYTFADGEPVKH